MGKIGAVLDVSSTSSIKETPAMEQQRLALESLTELRPAFPVRSGGPRVLQSENSIPLPDNYKLTKYDVINGRGRKSYNHIGNRRFRQMAALNLKRYYEAEVKADKSMVVAGLVQAMREACPSGGFLKIDPKRKAEQGWISVGGRETREKVGHCLRDMIASMREDPRRKDQLEVLQASKVCSRPRKRVRLPVSMSEQQKSILRKLEAGFDGSSLELLIKRAHRRSSDCS
eukprot:Nitzschia sp. Nitz4//scaffold4_size323378//57938//58859//NITZ4_000627-RA/size323378-snap-gene-0.403-mRNA-1//1//CDS//3329553300//2507//frame0